MGTAGNALHREPWHKGKLVGQIAPFKRKDIWALRVRLRMEGRVRELALFNRRTKDLRAVQLLLVVPCLTGRPGQSRNFA